MTVFCEDLREPQTLREVLDLFGRLRHHPALREAITEKIHSKIEEFLVPNVFSEVAVKEMLSQVFELLGILHQKLLTNPITYGIYGTMLPVTEACISRLADVVIKNLPDVHSTLLALYYAGGRECKYIGGYQWSNEIFGSHNPKGILHQWLVDEIGVTKDYGLMKRGFANEDLCNVNKSDSLSRYTGIRFKEGGLLSVGQYGLFFLSSGEFHDSQLVSVLLFLEEFCQEVNKGFSSMFRYYLASLPDEAAALRNACQKLPGQIELLMTTVLNSPYGNPDMRLKNCKCNSRIPKNVYQDRLKVEAFPKYLIWLNDNLEKVMQSLRNLATDGQKWDAEAIQNAVTSGPFKYGLILKKDEFDDSFRLALRLGAEAMCNKNTAMDKLFHYIRDDAIDHIKARIMYQPPSAFYVDEEILANPLDAELPPVSAAPQLDSVAGVKEDCKLPLNYFNDKGEADRNNYIEAVYRSQIHVYGAGVSNVSVMPLVAFVLFFVSKLF